MARYYCDVIDKKIVDVIAQDNTGVYKFINDNLVIQIYPPRETEIYIRGQKKMVKTTEKDYLEFIRIFDHNSYDVSTQTEIKEMEGSAQDVIKKVIAAGGK